MHHPCSLMMKLAIAAVSAGAVTSTTAADEWTWPDEQMRDGAVADEALTLLPTRPDGRVHHHENRITLTDSSLVDGWVKLDQCHRGLDPIDRVQITFSADRIEALTVERATKIGKARVEGATVQLQDVRAGATLCLSANSRALHVDGERGYVLRNGPYMRRFLDGYYPMHVTMEVRLTEDVQLAAVSPEPQPGFTVHADDEAIHLEAWFTGKLVTEIRLHASDP